RRAKRGEGRHAGVAPLEKFIVQFWLELPNCLPGLCFFGDSAVHDLLSYFGLVSSKPATTKQVRERLGLIQAGAKRHLIERVTQSAGELRITGKLLRTPYALTPAFPFKWDERTLWPRRRPSSKPEKKGRPDIAPLLKYRDEF